MDEGLSRNSDPNTSFAAGASINATQLMGLVENAVRLSMPNGLTIDELVLSTGLQKVTLSPRLAPLEREHRVARAGKRPGLSGRSQTIWKIPVNGSATIVT